MPRSRIHRRDRMHRIALWWHRVRGRRVVHLLHIGKTGGSALREALADRSSPTHVLVLHDHSTRLRSVPEGDGVAFFVRDPLTRFVSGFYSRQRRGRPRYEVAWSDEEAVAFRRFATPNQLGVALSAEDVGARQAAERAMRSIQHVRDSYWSWFGSEAYLRQRRADLLFVGAQESLAEDYARLCATLHLDGRRELPQDDVGAHRSPPDVDRDLESTAVENLRHWYAADYRFLALCAPLRSV